jgi:hypothetical protein
MLHTSRVQVFQHVPRGIVRAVRPDAERIAYIVKHLRERDREEVYALRWNNDPQAFVADVLTYAGAMSVVWELDDTPVAAQGSFPVRPGVWVNWCFGTDQWRFVLLSMTKYAKRFIIPALLRAGFHRAEAHALVSHTDARRWIESLGGRPEGIQQGLGRGGEDFITYVWTPDDVYGRR